MIKNSYLLLPLGSAMVYAVSALMLKRSMERGAGTWRTLFLTNWMMALVFLPFWFWREPVTGIGHTYEAVICGLLFFIGQIFSFLTLEKGDVSLATPVFGTKVILVAIFTVILLAQPLPWTHVTGVVLTLIALVLLQAEATSHLRGRALRTIVLGSCSSLSFALTDIFFQKWVSGYGLHRFVPVMFLTVGLCSLGLMPFFSAPLHYIGKEVFPWVLIGAFLMAFQASGIVLAIGKFGDATGVNVVYNSRSVFSIGLIWVVGHWFGNEERKVGGHWTMVRRLCGALLTMVAIVLVLR